MTKYLTIEKVIEIHDGLLQEHGGLGGIRDRGSLQSCVEMPKSFTFGVELHKTIYDKASSYIFYIVKNHPFNDGNKRCGAFCAIVFLKGNGVPIKFPMDTFEEMVVGVAEGKYNKEEIAHFLEFGRVKQLKAVR